MNDKYLLTPLEELGGYTNLVEAVYNKRSPLVLNGAIDENISHILYGLYSQLNRQILILTYNESKVNLIYESLSDIMKDNVGIYPEKEIIFYDIDASSHENKISRINMVSKLIENKIGILIGTVDTILDKIINKEIFKEYIIPIEKGKTINLDKLINRLIESGYERVYTVESIGQFSIRGGILDIFSPNSENAYRIELFGDEIDTIRYFSVKNQRSIKMTKKVDIYPINEVIVTDTIRENIVENLDFEIHEKLDKDNEKIQNKLKKYLDLIKEKNKINNEDIITPYINDKYLSSIVDYMNEDGIIFIDEPNRVKERLELSEEKFNFRISNLLEAGEITNQHKDIKYNKELIEGLIADKQIISSSSIMSNHMGIKPEGTYNISVKPTLNYHNQVELFIEDINYYLKNNYTILFFIENNSNISKISKIFNKNNILYSKKPNDKLEKGKVIILEGVLENGFEYPEIKYIIFSEKQIWNTRKKIKKKNKHKFGKEISSLKDLSEGSYVVHEEHGIGRYEGIEQLEIQGIIKDYITVRYKGQDKLYIPVNQMNLIQKYVGSDTHKPKINKLSSGEWQKTKLKARKAVEDMAEELLELYAKRESLEGYAFSKDTSWQREFEESFPYEETEGQLLSIDEIKSDMEKDKPMDRLLCGDVGYGKTEVALRAAFKAIMDGKQVAMLVPTTILAQQHHSTILERFKGFPINIGLLSRFRTKNEQQLDLKKLKRGELDIIVGTHRLLSKDVKFKDLGLLIIDEEQRFGVRDKERLKKLSTNIDVLTLTATPIPRTLHMSLVGIRDMSVLEEPPQERYPIQTYVVEYNEQMIRDAILKELSRDGQVYFVYNRVATIDKIASKLRKLIPEAKISIAHGQMGESKLEEEMISFSKGEIDVLVCTTIIETGLDIQNVNTIIVYDADKMGLSQLYQLRGRVGRTNRLAYGYFTYEKDKVLSEVAEKRLRAMKEFTEFGSGFKIAMRDLEIRGAGNLLGAKQHGHIEAIGYDLYVKFLSEAVKTLKGEKIKQKVETNIDLDIDGYIPDNFIKDTTQKIEIYKKISSIDGKEFYMDLMDEIIDRFGDVPEEVSNLMDISYIKYIGSENKISSITQKNKNLIIEPVENIDMRPELIQELSEKYLNKISFDLSLRPKIILSVRNGVLEELESLMKFINDVNKKIDEEEKHG